MVKVHRSAINHDELDQVSNFDFYKITLTGLFLRRSYHLKAKQNSHFKQEEFLLDGIVKAEERSTDFIWKLLFKYII